MPLLPGVIPHGTQDPEMAKHVANLMSHSPQMLSMQTKVYTRYANWQWLAKFTTPAAVEMCPGEKQNN